MEYGYLKPRYPIAVNINFYAVFLERVLPQGRPQCAVAAEIVHRIDTYRQEFFENQVEPEMMGKVPLDMSQFARMWTTERVPGIECDTLETHLPGDHVVVLVRGQFFKVMTRVDDGQQQRRRQLSAAALRVQFERCIVAATANANNAGGVGMLTAGDRTRWAKARNELLNHALNRATLDAIHTAYYVVCLDDESPKTQDELAALAIAGE